MEIRGTTKVIAVLGDPVSHSLSPSMHNPAFAAHGLDFAYVPFRVGRGDLGTAAAAMRAFSLRGANVTVPHKEAILPFLDEISETSRLMGVVNTIVNDDGRLSGTTTDPEGFLEGFRETGHSFAGKTVAVLGNGGSARTIAYALFLRDTPASVTLVARDTEKSRRLADEIADKLGKRPATASLAEYPRIADGMQIIVNATSLGMHPHVENSPLEPGALRPGQIVYDIVYTPERTRLLRQAEAAGLQTVGGLGMLVHQGLASFRLWTGITPDAGLFYRCARERLRA